MKCLKNKRIVIVGATGGIGRACAKKCAEHGAHVGVHGRSAEAAEALAKELGGTALGFDVRDRPKMETEARRFADAGGIDGWVNAFGIFRGGLLLTQDPVAIDELVLVNFLGTIAATHTALTHMLPKKHGAIVHVTSTSAVRPPRGSSVYSATKGGIESFSRAIAIEYAKKNIRSVCVRPGPTDTAMLAATRALAPDAVNTASAQGRVLRAEEVAALVAFLLSDEASAITGSTHAVDGGAP